MAKKKKLVERFCKYCGEEFQTTVYPMQCQNCYEYAYNTMLTAGSAIIGQHDKNGELESVLVTRRLIEPIGKWCFPGGYYEKGDDWRTNISREVKEETGIVIDLGRWVEMGTVHSGGHNHFIQIVAVEIQDHEREWLNEAVAKFVPNNEVSEIKLISKPIKMAWPNQTEIVKRLL